MMVADGFVAIGGNGADLGDGLGISTGSRHFRDLRFDRGLHRLVDTALEVHRVHARGNGLEAFGKDGLGQVPWQWWCHRRLRRMV